MKVIINGKHAELYTPYNSKFVRRIKGISSAKWDSKKGCWIILADQLDAARIIMTSVYGYNDQEENRTVKLKVTAKNEIFKYCSAIELFGKTLSYAHGRDSGAKVGDDVSLIKGYISSGGSMKNWKSEIGEGSVFILYNVNETVFKNTNYNEDNYLVEIIEDTVPDSNALLEEKERLLKRLQEIDSLLS